MRSQVVLNSNVCDANLPRPNSRKYSSDDFSLASVHRQTIGWSLYQGEGRLFKANEF